MARACPRHLLFFPSVARMLSTKIVLRAQAGSHLKKVRRARRAVPEWRDYAARRQFVA
jgi:hypothetical protein